MVEHVEHLTAGDVLARDDGLRCLQRPAAVEHGQAPERALLGLRQQRVTPLDGRAQGPLPRICGAWPASEQPEAVTQTIGQVRQRQRRHTCRREFECERHAIELPADLRQRQQVRLRQRQQARADGRRPLDEQRSSCELQYLLGRCPLGWHRERRDADLHLAGNGEGFPAGCQHGDVFGRAEDGVDEPGDRVDDVLAVVQHQQQPPVGEIGKQAGAHRRIRIGTVQRHAERVRDRQRHVIRVAHRRETGQMDMLLEVVGSWCAAAMARDVFPAPPGPTKVTRR